MRHTHVAQFTVTINGAFVKVAVLFLQNLESRKPTGIYATLREFTPLYAAHGFAQKVKVAIIFLTFAYRAAHRVSQMLYTPLRWNLHYG